MEPIRVKETVEIGDRKFTVQELTVREILDLVSGSAFVSGPPKSKEGVEAEQPEKEPSSIDISLMKEFAGIGADLENIMKRSCVDFDVKDLIELTPSSIKKVVEAFKRVNEDFLSSLKALGVAEALTEVRDAALSSFSKRLVTFSKLAM